MTKAADFRQKMLMAAVTNFREGGLFPHISEQPQKLPS